MRRISVKTRSRISVRFTTTSLRTRSRLQRNLRHRQVRQTGFRAFHQRPNHFTNRTRAFSSILGRLLHTFFRRMDTFRQHRITSFILRRQTTRNTFRKVGHTIRTSITNLRFNDNAHRITNTRRNRRRLRFFRNRLFISRRKPSSYSGNSVIRSTDYGKVYILGRYTFDLGN